MENKEELEYVEDCINVGMLRLRYYFVYANWVNIN